MTTLLSAVSSSSSAYLSTSIPLSNGVVASAATEVVTGQEEEESSRKISTEEENALVDPFMEAKNTASENNAENSAVSSSSSSPSSYDTTDITPYASTSSSIDVFDYYCNYYGLNATHYNATIAKQNRLTFVKMCSLFSTLGCCTATSISMIQQNQIKAIASLATGASFTPTIFPPCLLHYLNSHCSGVDLSYYCNNGSIANTTSLIGSIYIPYTSMSSKPAPTYSFPNMYNESSVLVLQGVITAFLVAKGLSVAPYYMSASTPFQVQIIDYTYYNSKLTNNNNYLLILTAIYI